MDTDFFAEAGTMGAEQKLAIYYDGACSFCLWSKGLVEPWDTQSRLRFLDINDPQVEASAPYPREELTREMHLQGPDGTWSAGFAAWVRILRVLPRFAWLGWMLGLPPFRWAGPSVYRWVAGHRSLLPGVPPACTTDTCAPRRRVT
jgi:predicted DCC family thiol-disulfide oxidoreductase YuxK